MFRKGYNEKSENKKTATARITIFALGSVLLLGILISLFSYFMYLDSTIDQYADRVADVSIAVASLVDPVRLTASIENDAPDAFWESVSRQFNDIYDRMPDLAYLYIIVPYRDGLYLYYVSTAIEDGFLILEEDAALYEGEATEAFIGGYTTVSEIEDAGEWGILISAFSPILDVDGNVIAVVGADIYADQAYSATNRFTLIMVIFNLTGSAIIGLIIFRLLSKVFKPIKILASRMKKTSDEGMITWSDSEKAELDEFLSRKDILGDLVASYDKLTEFLQAICDDLTLISEGKIDFDVNVRSNSDTMSLTLQKTIHDLNRMFIEVQSVTNQVAAGSKQIAAGSQSLAQGSTEQAASVQQLSASIAEIAQKTKDNASMAEKAAMLANDIKTSAEKGSQQMDEMMIAVKDINLSSQNISKVIKSIDDIAFQTNILALNAAVEAARAGQHGKGFAVVAEEVRNLAAKSAEAAKDTEALIADSIGKAELGSRIADDTAASLTEIVSGIGESSQLVIEIAKSSEEQSVGINQINSGIDQVAQVTQQNSATAEQSAASSQEMSGQSDLLGELISRFKLKNGDGFTRKALPPSNPHF